MNQCASQAMLQYHAKKKSSRWAIPRNHIPERFLMKCELPNRLQDKTALMPEYSYGVTKIRVTLDDGSQDSTTCLLRGETKLRKLVRVK